MSAQELITKHLDLWTGAATKKSSSGRGSNGKIELAGVKKLRELILELAVRGKLVEQDSTDEPACVLLEKIAGEKARLAKEGKIKKPKKLPVITEEEMLFELPKSWQWTRIWDVSEFITSGSRDWAKYYSDSGAIFITMGNLSRGDYKLKLNNIRYVSPPAGGEGARTSLQTGDLVVSITGDVGNLGLIPEGFGEAYINQHSCLVRFSSLCRNRYHAEFLRSPCAKGQFDEPQRGVKNSFRLSDMGEMLIPFPPLEEQHRIVQKVDEIMALCVRLEQQTSDQLEAHKTLVETLLGTLTQSENATELADNWARLAAHFDTLFTTEQSIDKLKQTILQLAVMGRLVEQDAGDEPAPTLLKQIALEIAKETKQDSARKRSQQSSNTKEPAPFNLPHGWCWERLEDLTTLITKGSSPKWQGISYTDKGEGTLFITSENVDRYRLKLKNEKFVENTFNDIQPRSQLRQGDILMNIVGASIGRTAIYDLKESANINQAVCLIRTPVSGMSREFLLYFFNSSVCLSYMFDQQVDNARANLSMSNIAKFLIPVPPKEEQNRIVQKVDELMALCDQLKERLSQASDTRCQLAGAVVEGAIM